MNRLDRLTAILIHLQTKRVVRAQELADRFTISLRTVYRDIRSLEEAGVPIGAEAGVGYFLTDYHLPPVMFTSAEASALLLAGKLVEKWADASIRTEFESALYKIKSVLKRSDQEHLSDLESHISVAKPRHRQPYSDGLLTHIQHAIARNHVLSIQYHSQYNDTETQREIEPVGLHHYRMSWHLIAFCRIRQDYRDFRIDRIRELVDTGERFPRQERLTLQEYLKRIGQEWAVDDVTLVFPKSVIRFMQEERHAYGYQREEDLGDHIRMYFQTPYLEGLARWLLMYGNAIRIEQPDSLLAIMRRLTAELHQHYTDETAAVASIENA